MSFTRTLGGLVLASTFVLGACFHHKAPAAPITNGERFARAMDELHRHKWDKAIADFERLTIDLPARDPLLPRAQFYLGEAHAGNGEHLLAAQAYSRMTESFPDDSLADDALLRAGNEYRKLWRKPSLDPEYGTTALNTYQTLLALYPNSGVRPEAEKQIAAVEGMFAEKDYDTGHFYLRRKGYDQAIIYFKDVVSQYPNAPAARKAYVGLADAYRRIHYREELQETCATAREKYPTDREVREACEGVAPPATTATTP